MNPHSFFHLAAAVLPALVLTAQAATVTVVVTGTDGLPAPNVVVQLMPARPVAARPASAPVVIAQRDVHFVPYLTAVPAGTTVRFSNQDAFDHHVRSQPAGPLGTIPPVKDFEFRLPAANGDKIGTADVKMDKPGIVMLGCHLHSSMRAHLFVSETSLVAVTDSSGRVVIADVPEGAVDLRTWHPDQLTDQPASPRQIAGATANLESVLNFTPPRPRARRG